MMRHWRYYLYSALRYLAPTTYYVADGYCHAIKRRRNNPEIEDVLDFLLINNTRNARRTKKQRGKWPKLSNTKVES